MTTTHPLQAVFNMADEEDTEDYSLTEYQSAPPVPSEPPVDHKDADDILVEKRIDEVYDAAMEAFNNQTAYIECVDPRFAARNAEVAANYLNIALQAATNRAKVKTDRRKVNTQFVPYNTGKTTQNLILADRNQLLKMITVEDKKPDSK